jgi:hypothetical protein
MAQLIIANPALVDRLMRAAVRHNMTVETLLDRLVDTIDGLTEETGDAPAEAPKTTALQRMLARVEARNTPLTLSFDPSDADDILAAELGLKNDNRHE